MRRVSNLLHKLSQRQKREPLFRFEADPQQITTAMPKVLWLELTSKCLYDCIFCTRKSRFGSGRHLDFEIYKSLIGELEFPEFIGLNYSGESILYPDLIEAIKTANSTGASTELVTAFSAISVDLIEGIVAAGLDRLAISLHTMNARQYKHIYRFGTLELLKERIDDLFRIKRKLHAEKSRLDFCFVAIYENLDQLVEVARYARDVGGSEIFVHPVIGRCSVSHDFSKELAANRLTEPFKEDLRRSVDAARASIPGKTEEGVLPAFAAMDRAYFHRQDSARTQLHESALPDQKQKSRSSASRPPACRPDKCESGAPSHPKADARSTIAPGLHGAKFHRSFLQNPHGMPAS
jgi:hypothetical protein